MDNKEIKQCNLLISNYNFP